MRSREENPDEQTYFACKIHFSEKLNDKNMNHMFNKMIPFQFQTIS